MLYAPRLQAGADQSSRGHPDLRPQHPTDPTAGRCPVSRSRLVVSRPRQAMAPPPDRRIEQPSRPEASPAGAKRGSRLYSQAPCLRVSFAISRCDDQTRRRTSNASMAVPCKRGTGPLAKVATDQSPGSSPLIHALGPLVLALSGAMNCRKHLRETAGLNLAPALVAGECKWLEMEGLRPKPTQAYPPYCEGPDGSETQQIQAFAASQQEVGERLRLT